MITVNVQNDSGTTVYSVTLEPAAQLRGVVTEPSLCPSKAKLLDIDRLDRVWVEAVVDEDCHITFDHLHPGDANVRISFDERFVWGQQMIFNTDSEAYVVFDDLEPIEPHPKDIWSPLMR